MKTRKIQINCKETPLKIPCELQEFSRIVLCHQLWLKTEGLSHGEDQSC